METKTWSNAATRDCYLNMEVLGLLSAEEIETVYRTIREDPHVVIGDMLCMSYEELVEDMLEKLENDMFCPVIKNILHCRMSQVNWVEIGEYILNGKKKETTTWLQVLTKGKNDDTT